jgi:hypothetical protein
VAVLLTAAPRVSLARIPNIPQVFPCRAFSPVGREAARGCKLNPQGCGRTPCFHLRILRFLRLTGRVC